jgi:hypothetical protein
MFKGECAECCVEILLLMLMEGQASSVCRPGARTPKDAKTQMRQNDDHIWGTLYKLCMFSGTLCNQYMCSVTLRNTACFQAPFAANACKAPFQTVHVFRQQSKFLGIGPSGVRALPLAAGINVGGRYKWHFFLFLSLFLSSLSLSPAHC